VARGMERSAGSLYVTAPACITEWQTFPSTKELYQYVIWAIRERIYGERGVWERPKHATKECGHLLPPVPMCDIFSSCCRGCGTLCWVPCPNHPRLRQRPLWVVPLLTVEPLCSVGAVRVPLCEVGLCPAGAVWVQRATQA
jgi:hypothetical protein